MRDEEGDDLLIYNPTSNSNKHFTYFEKFICNKIFIENNERFSLVVNQLFDYYKIRKHLKLKFDEYYAASIGSYLFRLIVKSRDSNIITFDDGALNVDYQSFYKWAADENRRELLYGRLLGIPTKKSILGSVCIHYTIYRIPNMLKANQYRHLSIVGKVNNNDFVLGVLKVLLGVPVHLLNKRGSVEDVKQATEDYRVLIENFDFNIFIPHPAEQIQMVMKDVSAENKGVFRDLVNSSIAEDVVIELIRMGFRVEVYGFGSSALINLSDICETFFIPLSQSLDLDYELFDRCGVKRYISKGDPLKLGGCK